MFYDLVSNDDNGYDPNKVLHKCVVSLKIVFIRYYIRYFADFYTKKIITFLGKNLILRLQLIFIFELDVFCKSLNSGLLIKFIFFPLYKRK